MRRDVSARREIRVLIADDHELVRQGLKRILLGTRRVGHIGEAATAQEVLDAVRKEKWDVVMLDINLPGRSGLEVLKEIRRAHPALPVLILSIHPEEQFAVRVVRAGANGYLNKSVASKELVEAVDRILEGGRYISPAVANQLFESVHRPSARPPHESLSDREDEVFRHIATGKTVGEIAEELCLSVKTVSTYRSKVLLKLGVKNNAQLMRYALDHKIEWGG